MKINVYDLYKNIKLQVKISNLATGGELKEVLCGIKKINTDEYKIRLVFSGCEIKNDEMLYQYKIKEGSLVQAMIFKLER